MSAVQGGVCCHQIKLGQRLVNWTFQHGELCMEQPGTLVHLKVDDVCCHTIEPLQ